MKNRINLIFILIIHVAFLDASAGFFTTGPDSFAIHMFGHASLMFEYNNLIIHVDPYSSQANYDQVPDADIILVTHGHGDHYDIGAISKIKSDSTILICTQEVKNKNTYAGNIHVLANGDSMAVKNVPVKAVPAYNIVNGSYHTKGVGNGYILTLGEKQIYIAGDTENIPEMNDLGKTDIAFLPMNLPYTMTPEMAADAAKMVQPDILYIYHFGNSDTASLRSLLSDQQIEIRIGRSEFYESAIREEVTQHFSPQAETGTVQMFPNPVRDKIYISIVSKGAMIEIYALGGQLLQTFELNDEGDHILDFSSLVKGIYVMRINDRQTEMTGMFYKE